MTGYSELPSMQSLDMQNTCSRQLIACMIPRHSGTLHSSEELMRVYTDAIYIRTYCLACEERLGGFDGSSVWYSRIVYPGDCAKPEEVCRYCSSSRSDLFLEVIASDTRDGAV